MNGVLTTLEREGLVERRRHPTHGRILQVFSSEEGQHRLDAANPAVCALEASLEPDFSAAEIATVKRWLVESAARLATWPAPPAA